MTMNNTRRDDFRIAEQAAEWAGTLDTAGPQEQAQFVAWLRESPKHVEEFLFAAAIYRELDGIDPHRQHNIDELLAKASANVVPLLSSADMQPASPVPTKSRSRPGLRWGAVAAALSGVVLLAALTWWQFAWKTYRTEIGEQRVFELSDGSRVHLNAHSRVEVHFSEHTREVRLLSGEALFTVARDKDRPFRVETDGAVIQAVGTQFNVYRRDQGTQVSVLEGAVRILVTQGHESDAQNVLAAGQEASIAHDGRVRRSDKADTAKAVSWQQRRLVFRDDSLADIVAEFNRYNRTLQIRVEGPAVSERRLSGVFDADAPESLLRFLGKRGDFSVERVGNIAVVRQRTE